MGLLGDDYKVLVIQMKVYRDESFGETDRGLGKKKGGKGKLYLHLSVQRIKNKGF